MKVKPFLFINTSNTNDHFLPLIFQMKTSRLNSISPIAGLEYFGPDLHQPPPPRRLRSNLSRNRTARDSRPGANAQKI